MRNRKEKGITLIMGTVSMLLIIPMTGMAIDVGFLYISKAKLQAAVDGAALAAARSLNVGLDVTAQKGTAKSQAVNWFYTNFPNGAYGTTNTSMDTSDAHVLVTPDDVNHIRTVAVTATTQVNTFFMKWLSFGATTVGANGTASRRDVVVMMVLDRSTSMDQANACTPMITAAKLFTGQFAAGRDRIGLVSFSDNVYLHTAPTANFRTVLGYTNASGSGNGALDQIDCNGGTGTAQGIAVAYNELYKTGLVGALNVIMLETDGQPNTLTLNFWDGTTAGVTNTGCKDKNNKTKGAGGFNNTAAVPDWAQLGVSGKVLGPGGAYPDIPPQMIGSLYSTDPANGTQFTWLYRPWATSATTSDNSSALANGASDPGRGCTFSETSVASVGDVAWIPTKDVYGNQLVPATNPYKTGITMNGTHVAANNWTVYRNALLNATDNAAYRARTNATIPAYFFAIGLAGSGAVSNDPDYVLMQRIANDAKADGFNSPQKYFACSTEPGCVTYADQPQGQFILSTDKNDLSRAFLEIASQVLRLSK